MNVTLEQLNPGPCRTYVLGQEGISEVALVDPVLEHVDDYIRMLEERRLTLTHVIDTHTHADHISGGPSLKDRTECEYVMHTSAPAHCVSYRVADEAKLFVAGIPIRVLHTPGHTKDGTTLVLPNAIMTGDTLFLDEGGGGRDDLPGGNPGEHWDSLQRVLGLPGELVVYPAHEYRGRRPSSLDTQRRTNPHLRPRSRLEFQRYLDDLKLGAADWMKDVLAANYACARDPRAAWIPVDVPACEVKGTLGANDQQVATVPVAALKDELAETSTRPVLLDVREASELIGELGRLDKIIHIPIAELAHRLAELDAFRSQNIVTVCRSGGRAHTAAQILMQAGFDRVRVLNGGMVEWNKHGFPVRRA